MLLVIIWVLVVGFVVFMSFQTKMNHALDASHHEVRKCQVDFTKNRYEIGYEDLQTFSRFFKKIEGVSPSDFKRAI